MSYQQRAVYVMNSFLDDFATSLSCRLCQAAYGDNKFDVKEVALFGGWTNHLLSGAVARPHLRLQGHGPADAAPPALRLPGQEPGGQDGVHPGGYLRRHGKAAMEGFRDVDKTRILVFYPKDGVSDVQELQMVTQEGDNVGVCGGGQLRRRPDRCQAPLLRRALREVLAERGYFFSSANSINWGRVLPQIVYYISAYCDLLRDGEDRRGRCCVPTGNFGDILAAYYAQDMGLPVGKLICA